MGINDLKLSEHLGKAAVAKKYREAIEKENERMRPKGIFTQQPKRTENLIKVKTEGKNRALFGDDTFDRLGVPHDIVIEEQEELEI